MRYSHDLRKLANTQYSILDMGYKLDTRSSIMGLAFCCLLYFDITFFYTLCNISHFNFNKYAVISSILALIILVLLCIFFSAFLMKARIQDSLARLR